MDHINLSEKINIVELLSNQKSVQIYLQGYSMYPLFVPGKDQAVISPLGNRRIRRGDVLLYRRKSGKLVLHRVYKIKGTKIYYVGDNQSEIEGPLSLMQVYGYMSVFYKGKMRFSVHNPLYFISWQIWLFLLPFRKPISQFIHKIKQHKTGTPK